MSNTPALTRNLMVAATVAATFVASPIQAQVPAPYDRALELASFDTAWTRVRDSYYDASMRGLNWLALRDSLRPRVEQGRSRDDTRSAITTLVSRLGESHFGLLPGEIDAGSAGKTDVAGDAGFEVRFV